MMNRTKKQFISNKISNKTSKNRTLKRKFKNIQYGGSDEKHTIIFNKNISYHIPLLTYDTNYKSIIYETDDDLKINNKKFKTIYDSPDENLLNLSLGIDNNYKSVMCDIDALQGENRRKKK